MARNPSWSKQNGLSFFKIMVGDLFFTRLRVPPAFLKNLKRIDFPTESTIALKSDTAVSWKVKMEKREGGHVYFTKGWKKVSKDMKLAIGDFLVFYLVGDAAFELRAYHQTCCQKMSGWCPSSRTETEPCGDDDEDNGYGDEEEEEGYADEEEEDCGDQDEEEDENEDGEEEIEYEVIEPDEPTLKKKCTMVICEE